jgi:chromosomal replication initiation ATPase DnaA
LALFSKPIQSKSLNNAGQGVSLMSSKLSAKDIINKGAELFDAKVCDILGDRRDQSIVRKRMAIAATLRSRRGYSYPRIGQLLNRDHSTIMYTCQRFREKPVVVKLFNRLNLELNRIELGGNLAAAYSDWDFVQ